MSYGYKEGRLGQSPEDYRMFGWSENDSLRVTVEQRPLELTDEKASHGEGYIKSVSATGKNKGPGPGTDVCRWQVRLWETLSDAEVVRNRKLSTTDTALSGNAVLDKLLNPIKPCIGADPEGARPRPSVPAAGRGCAGRYLPGLAPGIAWATGALHLCRGRMAALTLSRRELSLSAGSLQLERRRDLEHKRRDFTSCGNKKLYFDTHALVCLLEENGFSTRQAEITVSALVKITDANMDIIYKDMVTKMQQEITVQQIMSQIANVKKDMIILEKSEFSVLRAENEKINVELHRLKQQIMDEVVKVRTDTKLDFNLEKSRVKELYSLNERKLLEMRTEMVALHAQQDRAVSQTDRKIDTEVAGLRTMLESHKLSNIKYLAGSVFTCPTVAQGFYCLWI
ncbi:mitochondrial calcium uniporter regulator 1-like [Zalophus californianus]|uniref:Mitochondrial calcium uniporter regulator 1-like n=1 Tax=Zalophus californianus TaxID=9704 RepID=A0A6J2DV38_ZALCA|nr:mitochondrial calcium uniporter regulator 1-like [Zalophus californianus]